MSIFNFSKSSKISKFFIFITIFPLSFSFLSEENPDVIFHEKNLRKLGAEKVLFTFFKIFDYFYIPTFIVSYIALCIFYCFQIDVPNNDLDEKKISFFVNKILYIINIGYIISSGVNYFNDVQYIYSLIIFTCSLLYFVISSIIYIIISVNCKELCFPGICKWGYIKNMFIAPCCFFLPCKDEEFKKDHCCTLFKEDCCVKCCCLCCPACICLLLYITNIITYILGLLIYSLFWLIGKFFVFISCCDCWLKEDYDIDSDSFRFTKTSNTQLDEPDSYEEKEVKKVIDNVISKKKKEQIKKASNNMLKRFGNTIKKISKKLEEN